jgi:uncharacterized membrane protein
MNRGPSDWTEEQFDMLLARVLRAGVLVSAFIVLSGGVVYLRKYGLMTPDYGVFRGEPDDLRSVGGIVSAAVTLSGRGLIQLGLLVLIATPIARVVFSIIGFLVRRDWLYVAVSSFVLLLLAYSLTSG